MNKEYQENIFRLDRILHKLEIEEYDLDMAHEIVDKGLSIIEKCLEMLDESKGEIKLVTIKSGKPSYESFEL